MIKTVMQTNGMEFKKRFEEFKEHFGDLLDDETLRILVEYSFGIKPDIKSRYTSETFSERTSIGAFLNSGYCAANRGTGIFKGEKSIEINRCGDIEISDELKKSVRGIFIGSCDRKSVLIVNNSAWVCLGDLKCERGDLVEVKGFDTEKYFVVLDYKKIKRVDIPDIWIRISSLIPLKQANIRGRVSGFFGIKNVKDVDLAEISISDETGRIRVLLWGENAKIYRKLDIGDLIEIYNCYPKIGWDGELEVHCYEDSVIIRVDTY